MLRWADSGDPPPPCLGCVGRPRCGGQGALRRQVSPTLGRGQASQDPSKGIPTIFQEVVAPEGLKKCNIYPAGVERMLQAWGAWTSGRGRGAPGRRPGRLSGASHLQRRCLLHPRGRGTQTPPSLRPAWYLGLERTQVGGPGRRALTCYRNWHQVSREEGAQRTRIVGGASAPLIGDCTPRSAGSPELAPLLPPPARPARQQGRSPAGRAPGRLTGGAGPPAGRGGAWGGATAGRPPTCDGPGPIRAVRPSTQGKGLICGRRLLWTRPFSPEGGVWSSFIPHTHVQHLLCALLLAPS